MTSILRFSAIASLLALAACSEEGITGTTTPVEDTGASDLVKVQEKLGLDTMLSEHTVLAGEKVVVTCVVHDQDGKEVDKPTGVWLSPEQGLTLSDHTLVTSVPGKFKVACTLLDPKMVDLDFQTLTVMDGPPVQVEAKVDPDTIAAGDPASVTCTVTDALGTVLEETTSVIADGMTVDDHEVSATEPGTYEVRCVVEGYPKLKSIPDDVTVEAAVPATIELTVTPDKEVYDQGDLATFSWTVEDAYGNLLEDVPATLTAPTEGVKEINEVKYKLLKDGYYTFTVTLDPPNEPLQDSVTLLVDFSDPEVVITWPERGETIEGGAKEDVMIQGTVTDAGGIDSFEINGQAVELAGDGSFTFPMPPKWGMNVIIAVAKDKVGHETRITPTYYYSTAFLSYEGASAGDVKLDDGLTLLLGQAFLDDGDHDPTHPNDLATIVEGLLGSLDLGSLIPTLNIPGFGSTLPGIVNFSFPGPAGTTIDMQGDLAFELVVGQPTLGKPTVSLDSRDGGIDMGLGLGKEGSSAFVLPLTLELSVPVTLTINFTNPLTGNEEQLPFDVTGKASVKTGLQIVHIGVLTKLDIALAPGGQAEVNVADIEFQMDGVGLVPIEEIIIDFGDLQILPFLPPIPLKVDLMQFFPQIAGLMSNLVLDPFIDAIEPQISGLIEPLIDQAVGAVVQPLFDALNLETALPLPNLLGGAGADPIDLLLALGLTSISFTDDGGQVGLGIGLGADKGVDRFPLGVPLRDGCLNGTGDGIFEYGWERSVGLASKTDVVNELLFALWWSGSLNNTLDPSALGALGGGGGGGGLSLDGVVLTPDFLLPPIANDCNKAGLIEIQVGDLYLDLNVNAYGFAVDATMYADISIQAFILTGPDGITLKLGDFTVLDLEVLEVGGGLGGLFDVEALIKETLVPMLVDNVAGLELGPIALPPIDLGGLLPGVPPGTAFQLGELEVTKQSGYLIFAGDLQ